nr:tellurite resistance TerB family protein [uncultured Carboxylicivirga sp.]
MGIFDKVFNQTELSAEKTFTKQEAFLATAVAIAGSDGYVSDEEWSNLVGYVRRIKLFSGCSDIDFNKMFDRLFTILKTKGPGALVQMAKPAMEEDLKLTAFCCAVDIALSDGILEEEEKDVLDQLMQVLEVPEATAISIIEVMLIKNKM